MMSINYSRFHRIIYAVGLVLLTGCLSFKDVDLESVIIKQGDLPNSLVAGYIEALQENEYFKYDTAYSQIIMTESGESAGEVSVFLFHNKRWRDEMYNVFTLMETQEGIIVYETPPIGDETLARQEISDSGILNINLTFVQCYAVANIALHSTNEFILNGDDVIAYAEKLAARLSGIACQ
jgi:hypothetical protein